MRLFLKIIAFIVAGIILIDGCLFILAACSPQNLYKGSTLFWGLIQIVVSLAVVLALTLRKHKPIQKLEPTDRISPVGNVKRKRQIHTFAIIASIVLILLCAVYLLN